MKNRIRIVFSDLDGTLLTTDGAISNADLGCLHELGRQQITRVIATGRSLYSYRKVIAPDFPADYVIFSTGAGIFDLRSNRLICSSHLERGDILKITGHLRNHQADFMVHNMVPDNHLFTYCGDPDTNNDFRRRLQIYRQFARKFISPASLPQKSAQIIAIFADDLPRFIAVKDGLNGYQVTRTTSPLDGRSIWMEIFPAHVSKGESARWLCRYLRIDPKESLSIGNDFNDVHLLDFTAYSYVVANAPDELRRKYRETLSHNDSGFSTAVSSFIFP